MGKPQGRRDAEGGDDQKRERQPGADDESKVWQHRIPLLRVRRPYARDREHLRERMQER